MATIDQYEAAYEVAVRVDAAEITTAVGAAMLERETGLSGSYAKIFIRNYQHLIRGERFRRTTSVDAMRYFLGRIFADNGPDIRANAVRALESHIDYYESGSAGAARGMRAIAVEFADKVGESPTAAQISATFERDVEASLRTPETELLARLHAKAKEPPKQIVVKTTVFLRDPDVVAAALLRANGRCEECGHAAPFFRARDGSPYLEVHHDLQLAKGGLDVLANARALCPNCHRRMHFGPR